MSDYIKLYLKYKNKYLNLKKTLASNNDKLIEKILKDNQEFVNIDNETIKEFMYKNYATTYGEVTLEGFTTMMDSIKQLGFNNELRFADLGSGTGKLNIIAVHYFNAIISYGVEFAKERHDKAMDIYKQLPEEYKDIITLEHGDLFNSDLTKFNVIHISNLCFSEETNLLLADKLKEVNKGTFILCTKKIKAEYLKFIKQIQIKTTWTNNSKLNIYIKA